MIPYYIILHPFNTKRIRYVKTQIDKYKDKNFIIIRAIIPEDIKNFLVNNQISMKKGKYFAAKLACHLSHYLAYKTIIESGCEKAIILEDDFVLFNDHDKQINNILNELPVDFDLVRLFHSNVNIIPLKDKRYIGEQSTPIGDVGNLVTCNGAIKIKNQLGNIILKEKDEGFIPNDVSIYNLGQEGKIKSFNSVKLVVGTMGNISKFEEGQLGSTIWNDESTYIKE